VPALEGHHADNGEFVALDVTVSRPAAECYNLPDLE
jgi:hypothetical protein